ncbi:hypothetical protein BGW42_001584 [Actinomortierella wolfii]|nr:hypothetical protein BGW42_001584 [Actinomortierella wolfii]
MEPSALQREFIPPILLGQDVLIRDTTGSGKTFGVLLALLSKPRVQIPLQIRKQLKGRRSAVRPGITSVFIVPNQELAFQLLEWTKQLLSDLINDGYNQVPLDALIQVITTSTSQAHDAQVAKLAETLPHVLVATPSRLWTLLEEGMLDLSMIETLVLDEVDHLIRIPSRYATHRQLVNRDIHPKPAELAVREILRSARALGRYPDDNEEDDEDDSDSEENAELAAMKKEIKELEQTIEARRKGGELANQVQPDQIRTLKKPAKSKTDILEKRIQLIASSATMNRTVRHWLQSMKWVQEPVWVDTTKSVVLPKGIQHYCLVVGPDSIRNMKVVADPYKSQSSPTALSLDLQEKDDEDIDEDEQKYRDWAATDKEWQDAERAWQQQQVEKAETGHLRVHDSDEPKSFPDDDDRMLESVVNACTLEEASTACVFFCNQPSLRNISTRFASQFDFPVKMIQEAFVQKQQVAESTGTNTMPVALSTFSTEHARVFVANEMNARGLDLPNVSHVVIVGLPSCPSSYLHMAGRTGRFGKTGKVITILRDEGRIEDRARTLFKTLQVNIEPFPHVD